MRFLVVDDGRTLEAISATDLGPRASCQSASNGREAIALFRQALENDNPYDAILLDSVMPDMDGHETVQRIRLIEQEFGRFGNEAVKVVMTTTRREANSHIPAPRGGCDRYLGKPIDQKELLAELQELGVLC